MSEATLVKHDVEQVVHECIGTDLVSKLDRDLLDWTVEMIITELEDRPSSTVDQLNERIGGFLGECGLAVTQQGGPKSTDFFQLVCLKLTDQINQLAANTDVETLTEDVNMADLVNTDASQFVDPFLGISPENNVNYNASTSINDLLAERKARLKEREKALRAMKDWERTKVPWPSPMVVHGNEEKRAAMIDIIVDGFSLGIGGRELLKEADLKVVMGHKYGLIGRNGIGKSTLLGAMVRGEIKGIEKALNIACVEQDVEWLDGETALEAVLRVDKERSDLMQEVSDLQATIGEVLDEACAQTQTAMRIAWIYDRLSTIEADKAPTFAIALLKGLGLSDMMINVPVTSLSGGWRIRVALARGLFSNPDVMLLDEPTNHLDLHAVAWLMNYLVKWNKTCIIVSHAREFLNEVCTDMIEFKDMKLNYYKGNFDTYERVASVNEHLAAKRYESQAIYIAEQEKFINRFRAKASKATQVQSRVKMLAKLPKLEAVKKDPALVFNFFEPDPIDGTYISIQEGKAIYPTDPLKREILTHVDFMVDRDSRVAVCGSNGSGKSTLLKQLTGDLPVIGLDANYVRNPKLKIGYFGQHHVEALDMSLNAVSSLVMRYSTDQEPIPDLEARSFLGRFGITGSLALEPLFILSGGQKSRVALALMAYDRPHLLILDEPTNHLDLEAVQSLIGALNDFDGGVVVVSHDAFLLSCVVDEVYHVEPSNKSVTKFRGNFDLYKKLLLKGGPTANPIEMSKDAALVSRLEVHES
eukprot:GHVH01012303.1.p1 GENE.GHVH01012303.1~~GHVH01012303.1.p1  ORF type:complete len:757 (-),score=134.38 GHVH01012303.1:65-2335(-)